MKNCEYSDSRFLENATAVAQKRCREKFAELRKTFQALSRSEQYILRLKAMNGGEITASRRLKKKMRNNKRTFYY